MNRVNIWKMSKNVNFSETRFSQVNDVGLSMYVVNNMILNYFIEN